jgi:transcriptional regulator with GAF, ATPase, and Fis domain
MTALAQQLVAREVDPDKDLLSSDSAAMQRVLQLARGVSPTPASVLITGESGTGKEVLARLIHKRSNRASMPYVAVNCGAVVSSLAESELFGHEKGAFSGAIERRIGRFEAANKGTLLLDEISEMPHALQTKLLRVLQEREIYRVGSTNSITVDVRITARIFTTD